MVNKKLAKKNEESSYSLSKDEQTEIQDKLDYELNEVQHKMIVSGGIINGLAGIFVAYILSGQVQSSILTAWITTLLCINVINITFSIYYHYRKIPPDKMRPWRFIYHCILAALSLTWGSIGVIFIPNNVHYQMFTITCLQIAVVAFSFGTITDFRATVISAICVLLPYVGLRIISAAYSTFTVGYDPNLNSAFGISLTILATFLIASSYIGYRLIKNAFLLNFTNIVLGRKLGNMNKLLENRVKERTLELENSLKLVQYQANHDLLTDLPNQRSLSGYINTAITAANEHHMFAVIAFSLNEIAKINDGLGHQAGDYIIKAVAERFRQKFENTVVNQIKYTVALTRKDVFVIIAEPINVLDDVEPIVQTIFTILSDPIYTEKQVVRMTASVGVSLYPRNGRDLKTLLMNADAAMLRAHKQGGNSMHMYKSEINADISKQLEIESNLHSALINSEFMLQYQPFVDLKTGEICGMEALVRWENPSLGFISPGDFIPLAEANGIIIPLGEWVLRTACLQTKTWHRLGFTKLKVAVNLSSKQLQQRNIIQIIKNILEETQLDPACLELELTETEAFQADAIPILQQFKTMGVGLSIDDFGTGYSGLANLKLFSISKLKIDKSFVQDIGTNKDSKAIVSNTIELAKSLNIAVLAEGVETKEQLKFLRDNGCDMIQGFYFSTPVHPDVFTELLINKSHLSLL